MTKKRSNATTKSKKTAKAVKNKAHHVQNAAKIKRPRARHCKDKVLFKLHSLFKTKHHSEQANVLQNNAGVPEAERCKDQA